MKKVDILSEVQDLISHLKDTKHTTQALLLDAALKEWSTTPSEKLGLLRDVLLTLNVPEAMESEKQRIIKSIDYEFEKVNATFPWAFIKQLARLFDRYRE